MRKLAAAGGSIVGLASLLVACGHRPPACTASQQAPPSRRQAANQVVAAPVHPDPRVGAIFLGGGDLHTCTGSVLHSAAGNLVLTAAHCLAGGGRRPSFPVSPAAPRPPIVVADVLYLDPRWVANKDPRADYVIARVSRADGGSVEAQVGSALSLGSPRRKAARSTSSPTLPASAACRSAARSARGSATAAIPNCRARAWSRAPVARPGSAARRVTG